MAVAGSIGSVTVTDLGNRLVKVAIPWTSDAASGAVTEIPVSLPGGTLIQIETDPGATAPDDNYDVSLLKHLGGSDYLFGVGQNRDTANTEVAGVVFTSTSLHPYLEAGDYFPTIAAAGNSKVGTIYLYIARGLVGI